MIPRTLEDLLNIFMEQSQIPMHRKRQIRVACGRAARAIGYSTTMNVPVRKLFCARDALEVYLAATRLLPNTQQSYRFSYNRFINWCKDRDLLPHKLSNHLSHEWREISGPLLGVSLRRKQQRSSFRSLGRWASIYGISPANLSQDDIISYVQYLECESGLVTWRKIYKRTAREWDLISEQGRLPSLTWSKLYTNKRSKYALMLHEWSPQMQRDYQAYREWCTKPFQLNRNPKYKQREESADSLLRCLQRIAGFATKIYGLDKASLNVTSFLDQEIIQAYCEWMMNERLGGRPTTTLGRIIGQLIGMARGYYDRPEVLEWLYMLKEQLYCSPSRSKRIYLLSIEQLESIPNNICSSRRLLIEKAKMNNRRVNAQKHAALVRDELIFRLLIRRPLRQKNLREIQIGKNLVEIGENQYILHFDASEMKNDHPFEISFPADLVPLLKKYRANCRPILCTGFNTDYLFPNAYGGHLGQNGINKIVKKYTRQFLGKHLTPHLIRDCVAHWLIQQDPGNLLMVSMLLGHRDINTTIQSYCNIDPVDAAEHYDEIRKEKKSRKYI